MPKTVTKKKATKKKTTTKTERKKGQNKKIKKFQRKKRRLHTFPCVLKNKKNKQWRQYIPRQRLFLMVS